MKGHVLPLAYFYMSANEFAKAAECAHQPNTKVNVWCCVCSCLLRVCFLSLTIRIGFRSFCVDFYVFKRVCEKRAMHIFLISNNFTLSASVFCLFGVALSACKLVSGAWWHRRKEAQWAAELWRAQLARASAAQRVSKTKHRLIGAHQLLSFCVSNE